jgi:uncharacterized protein (DUF362 family)
VFRPLSAFAAVIVCFPAPARAAEQTLAPPSRATIHVAQDDLAIGQFQEDAARTRRMVDALVVAVTQQSDVPRAWRSLVAPTDRVGIKVATAGGRYFSSHPGVVAAVIAGLESAGVPRSRMLVWDRDMAQLRAAGLTSERLGVPVRAVDPPRGFDREAKFTSAVLGKLIWGDLLFAEKRPKPGRRVNEDDQLSSTSHLATIFREVTKIVNVPVLSDEAGCGVAGALYNVTVPAIDNWRRFTQPPGAAGIAELYADERIGPKVVLHLMDALLAQYAGGPGFQPNYAFAHGTLYASRDPVALDAHALRLIDRWREPAKLPKVGKPGEWLQDAAQMGLGVAEESRIDLRPVAPLP